MRTSPLFLLLLFSACSATVAPPPPGPAPEPVATGAAPDPELEQRLELLAADLERERVTHHIPGMALALVRGDRTIWSRGFGLADLEEERAVDTETIFAVGSTTKAFTATLVGMLADEERIRWDDPVTAHLPELRLPIEDEEGEALESDRVLIRDLLSHRTGFTRMGVLWASGSASRGHILLTATGALAWAPFRSGFHYNNVMYLAAGEACATATGRSWDELVRERILEPLDMRSTTTSIRDVEDDPRLASGYRWNEETGAFEDLPMRNLDSIAPAGAINSNVTDMTRWIRLLLRSGVFEGQRLIGEQNLNETWEPHIRIAEDVDYGLGWFLHTWREQPYLEHGGNIDGFAAEVALLPQADTGLVLLMNVSSSPLQRSIGPLVWEHLYGELPGDTVEAEAVETKDDFADYVGTYVADFGPFHEVDFEVLVQNERLAIDVPGQIVYELLEPDEEGRRAFAVVPDQIQADFVRDERGEVTLLRMYQGGLVFEIPRAGYEFPVEIPLEELAEFLGSYEDPVLEEPFGVVIQNNRLAIDYPQQMVYELRPPDEAGLRSFRVSDELAAEFHRGDDETVESLTFHERGTERLCPRVGEGEPEALPSLEELLARRNGKAFQARLAELGACRQVGRVRLLHSGVEGQVTTTLFGADHLRVDTDLAPFGTSHSSVHGPEHAWTVSSFSPFDELEGKYHDQALLAHPAAFFGDWELYFDSGQVLRTTLKSGEKHFVVRLRRGDLPPTLLHVRVADAEVTGAEVSTLIPGLGPIPVSLEFADFRDADGLRLPFEITAEDPASGRIETSYESFESGLQIEDDFFVLRREDG